MQNQSGKIRDMAEEFVNADRFKLTDKVALVTGAGRGIGCACAMSLAAAGAKVIAVARTRSDLGELEASAPGGGIEPWCEDVTNTRFYERVEALNSLDVLVNNAGFNKPQPLVDVDDDILDQMVSLNILAMFRTARAGARVMIKTAIGGSVINMSSQMGHVGSPGRTVYCMTKHGVEGLTRAMAVELAPHGIRVNSVAPTFIETPMTQPMMENDDFREFVENRIPMGRVGKVSDVAAAVLFLASPAAGMITGDSLKVDGGWTAQ